MTSCGGDVVGTWDVDSYCLAFTESPAPADVPECRDALSDYGADVDGTLTFGTDGMVTTTLTTQIHVEANFTNACVQALGGTNVTQALCDELESTYAMNPEYESAVCTLLQAACRCSIVGVPSTSTGSEPYSIQGNQLVFVDSEPSDYCVKGDSLTIGAVAPEGSYSLGAHRAP